ncbi:MAG: hypothetical protein ACPG44_04430 [Polaribacter sp.]
MSYIKLSENQFRKKFDFKTHIYGHQIDAYEFKFLKEIYPLENTDYMIWGKMKKDIFISLIDCLKNSRSVKRKYQKILRN